VALPGEVVEEQANIVPVARATCMPLVDTSLRHSTILHVESVRNGRNYVLSRITQQDDLLARRSWVHRTARIVARTQRT
jgi:hypothetical protein